MGQRSVSAVSEYTVRDQQMMTSASRYFEWQARIVRKEIGARVLEIGCGMGNFTRHLLDRELVIGIDVDAACLALLKERLEHARNVVAEHVDVLDPNFLRLRDHQPDSIVCLNVLEHISDDEQALSNMAKVLPVGGRVVLIVPACEQLYGPIDQNLGHYRRYSKSLLRRLAARAGFRVPILRHMNCVGFIGWWINARLLKKTHQSEGQIAVFDRLVVPVLSRVETMLEPPFGQSLFAVLEKTGPALQFHHN